MGQTNKASPLLPSGFPSETTFICAAVSGRKVQWGYRDQVARPGTNERRHAGTAFVIWSCEMVRRLVMVTKLVTMRSCVRRFLQIN